jgi:transposase-like protein
MNQELGLAQSKFTYIDKWTSNDQINHKLSNQFWKNPRITNAQITQTLKFRYAQYMGNHRKNLFWPNLFPNPKCTLCPQQYHRKHGHTYSLHVQTPHRKGLCIARHNKGVHQIAHTLQSNKFTRYYTLINAGNQNFRPQDNTIPQWLLQCTCPTTTCTCLARLRPDILCLLGAPTDIQTPP